MSRIVDCSPAVAAILDQLEELTDRENAMLRRHADERNAIRARRDNLTARFIGECRKERGEEPLRPDAPYRIDPEGCGCTDCITGWSAPLATYPPTRLEQARRILSGKSDNATGRDVLEWTGTETSDA